VGEAEVRWVPVREAVKWLNRDNPKLHDIGGVIQSIERHGFRGTPIFDRNLYRIGQTDDEEPMGAIVAGNGRTEALAMMEVDGRYGCPKRCAYDVNNIWWMEMNFGADADNILEASAFSIDANHLTLGGDHSAADKALLWDPTGFRAVMDRLAESGHLPVSFDGDEYDWMVKFEDTDWSDYDKADPDEPEDAKTKMVTIKVQFEYRKLLPEVAASLKTWADSHEDWGIEINV